MYIKKRHSPRGSVNRLSCKLIEMLVAKRSRCPSMQGNRWGRLEECEERRSVPRRVFKGRIAVDLYPETWIQRGQRAGFESDCHEKRKGVRR